MRCNRLMTLMRRKRRQYLAQLGDQFFGPFFPGRSNNAGGNLVKFLRQLLFAPCAFSPPDHCARITSKRLAGAQADGRAIVGETIGKSKPGGRDESVKDE